MFVSGRVESKILLRKIYFLRTVRITHTGGNIWWVGDGDKPFRRCVFGGHATKKKVGHTFFASRCFGFDNSRGRRAFYRKDNLITVARVSNIIIYVFAFFLGFCVAAGNARDSIRCTIIFIHACMYGLFGDKNEIMLETMGIKYIHYYCTYATCLPMIFRNRYVRAKRMAGARIERYFSIALYTIISSRYVQITNRTDRRDRSTSRFIVTSFIASVYYGIQA